MPSYKAPNPPELLAKQFSTKLNVVPFSSFAPFSGKRVWWECDKGHEWEAVMAERSRGSGCPYCTGVRVLKGFNDLATINPELAKDWDYENNAKTPEDITYGSGQLVSWLCNKGHSWKVRVSDRKFGNGCKKCHSERKITNNQTLDFTHPYLLDEWDFSENVNISPGIVSYGSRNKVSWICSKGHKWKVRISDRISANTGCPKCHKESFYSNGKSLGETHPELLEEWDYDKNKDLTPQTTSKGSSLKAHWICSLGHQWYTSIADRARGKSNCPTCSSTRYQSAAEREIFDFLANMGVKVLESNRTVLNGRELDLWIPEHDLAIEFNGVYWHSEANGKSKYYHFDKFNDCKQQGVDLIQIWEDDWNSNKDAILAYIADRLSKTNAGLVESKIIASPSGDALYVLSDNSNSDWRWLLANGFILEQEIEPDYSFVVNGVRVLKESIVSSGFKNKIWDAGKQLFVKYL